MNETACILCAISADKPTTIDQLHAALDPTGPNFNELCFALEALETQELVEIKRVSRSSRAFKTLQLTPLGAERAREAMEGREISPCAKLQPAVRKEQS